MTGILSSCDIQTSRTICIAFVLPIVPAGMVWVVRVPVGPPPMHGGGWFGPGSRIMPFDTGMGGTVTGAPYSAVQVTEMVQKLGDGNTIVEKSQTNVYRDAQGRMRIEHMLPSRPGSSSTSQTAA